MKSYLMFGILLCLLKQKRCTIKHLAEKFEVSTKTISRYVLSLAISGVPIISFAGKSGGIEIENTFSLENCFFTAEEQSTLLSLLESNDAFLDTDLKQALKLKLSFSKQCDLAKNEHITTAPNVCVDVLPWYQSFKQNKMYNKLKQLCFQNKKLLIQYEKFDGSISTRIIEPHLVIYKENSLYLYAYCESKQAFRLFKALRIKSIQKTEQTFIRKKIDYASEPWNNSNFESIKLKFWYNPAVLPEIEEWLSNYSVDSKNHEIEASQPLNNWLINKILSFENNIKILAPDVVINQIKATCLKIGSQYA